MEAYFDEMSRVSFKLLEAFCSALAIPLDSMHHLFDVGGGCAGWGLRGRGLETAGGAWEGEEGGGSATAPAPHLAIPLRPSPSLQENHTSFMRLNYYPAQRPGEQRMALNHHTGAVRSKAGAAG